MNFDTRLVHGAFSGRFYAGDYDLPAIRTQILLDNPARSRNPETSSGLRLRRWFCTSTAPWGDRLEEEKAPLGYDPSQGIMRCFVREEERKPSSILVQSRARALHADDGGSVPFERLDKETKDALLGIARDQLLETTPPKISFVEVVATPSWCFVGRVAAQTPPFQTALPQRNEPLVWGHGEDRFQAFAQAALEHVVSEGPRLDADVTLVHLHLSGGAVDLSAAMDPREAPGGGAGSGAGATASVTQEGRPSIARDLLERLLKHDPNPSVQRLTFRVQSAGDATEVTMDEHGYRTGTAPPSQGGFVRDQVMRRFTDVRDAAERVGEVLAAKVEKILAAKVEKILAAREAS